MFHPVAAAAVKMTAAAGCSTGLAHFAGNFTQINGWENLFPKLSFFIGGVAAGGREFTVALSGIMTDQTINPLLR